MARQERVNTVHPPDVFQLAGVGLVLHRADERQGGITEKGGGPAIRLKGKAD